MKTNYILIDLENIQPPNIPSSNGIPIIVFVFLGQNQTKLPRGLVVSLQSLDDVRYVEIQGNGKNALDFHMAYFLGKLSEKDKNSYFHIVTRDKGFDPLIKYLKGEKVWIQRVEDLSEIWVFKMNQLSSNQERAVDYEKFLKALGKSKPRRLNPLINSIKAHFMETLDESQINEIVSILKSRNTISVKDQTISYSSSTSKN